MKTLLISIAFLLLFGCVSHESCIECDTRNWIPNLNKSSQKSIDQITSILFEQGYNDSLSFIFQNDKQSEFLIARDSLQMNYPVKTMKWFKEHPESWISIDSIAVKVSINYCEKWCEGMPDVSQLFLVQTKSNPTLLWEKALAKVEELIHLKEDWYLVKTRCIGCGL